eukprot:Lithocolla_globosa_v1_NODE_3087_length_1769_cov_5.781214.p3 type:complete len:100 gc:universal NODE_3087_length_1769_cov_5.781214:1302-1003(-)
MSRLVIKCRWVVEAYHGRFKKFKFFDNRQPTCHLTHIEQYLRITTAALNKYRPPLVDTSGLNHETIAKEMKRKSEENINQVFFIFFFSTFVYELALFFI